MLRIRTLVVVAGILVVAGCGGAASRFQSHLQRGRAYMDKGDYAHANIEFRNAMQIAPQDTSALLLAGQAAEKLGQLRDAVGLYQSAIDLTPDGAEARARLGRLYVFAGVPQRAIEIVEPGLAKHPDDVPLLIARAAARARTKNDTGAVADADHALRLAPTNPDAIATRAGLYRRAGDVSHAIELLSNGVKQLPRSTDLRDVLAQIYLAGDEPDRAEEQLRALVQLDPQSMRYRGQLAAFYVHAKKLDDAQHVLEDAVKALPKDDNAKLVLVNFLGTQRTREQGEKLLREFVAQDPANYALRFSLGDLLQRAGATQEALQTYNDIVNRNGTGAQGLMARDRIASMDLEQGRVDEARKLADQVLQKSPRDNDALLVRSKIELAAHDPVAAIADLRAILRDQPRSVLAQRLLARAYLANEQAALAEQALRAALDVVPTDVSVRIELAQVLMSSAQTDRAVALLEETVHNQPGDGQAREMLVRAYLAKPDLPAARSAVEALKAAQPGAAAPAFLAGVVAERQNRLEDAQKEFERALAIQPQVFDALAALVRLEVTRHEDARAIALARNAAEHDGKNPLPYNLLGELDLREKDTPAAIEAFDKAINLAPAWWPARRNLALAKLAAQDTTGAIAAYEAAIQSAPAQPQLVTELASLYEKQSRTDDAITLYETWLKRNPGVQGIANNLAMLLVTYKTDQHSLDRAKELSAAFSASVNGSLLDTYGWVRFKTGDLHDALPTLERAADRAPDAKEIRYHLAMAQLKSGDRDKARVNLQTALSGAANFTGSNEARQTLASLTGGRTG